MNRLAVAALSAVAVVAGVALLAFRQDGGEEEGRVVVLDVAASRYRYDLGPNQTFLVERGTTVVFRVTSLDVAHGFAVEELLPRGVEAQPGQVVEARIRADRAGEFRIYCTLFCGSGHPDHGATLVVAG